MTENRTPTRASLDQVVQTGPDVPDEERPGGAPYVRTGFGSLPNPNFARPKDPRTPPDIASPVDVEFEDGQAYTVIRVREERAKSYSARTIDPNKGVPYLAAGQDDKRTVLTISANGGPVLVGTLSDVGAGQGYTIPTGQTLTTHLTDAIYVVSPDGAATIGLWTERDE